MKKELNIENLQVAVEINLMKDGFLVPIIFMVTAEKSEVANISELLQIENKEKLFTSIAEYVLDKQVYKVIIVSEAWLYKAPVELNKEQIKEVVDMQRHEYQFEKMEVYQIMEITNSDVRMMSKPFYSEKDEQGKVIVTFGNQILSDKVDYPRAMCVQNLLMKTH